MSQHVVALVNRNHTTTKVLIAHTNVLDEARKLTKDGQFGVTLCMYRFKNDPEAPMFRWSYVPPRS